MLRNVISQNHPVFGDDYVKLRDEDRLEPGDQTACVSTLLSVEGESWSSVDKWGATVRDATVRDADGNERVFRRLRSRVMERVCRLVSAGDNSPEPGELVQLARLALGSKK